MGNPYDTLFDSHRDYDGHGDEIVVGKTCNRCGESGLHWDDPRGEGWRLVNDDGEQHYCPSKSEEGFEDLT